MLAGHFPLWYLKIFLNPSLYYYQILVSSSDLPTRCIYFLLPPPKPRILPLDAYDTFVSTQFKSISTTTIESIFLKDKFYFINFILQTPQLLAIKSLKYKFLAWPLTQTEFYFKLKVFRYSVEWCSRIMFNENSKMQNKKFIKVIPHIQKNSQ